MPVDAAKISKARSLGYSDDEILQELFKGTEGSKIAKAQEAGYSTREILDHYVSSPLTNNPLEGTGPLRPGQERYQQPSPQAGGDIPFPTTTATGAQARDALEGLITSTSASSMIPAGIGLTGAIKAGSAVPFLLKSARALAVAMASGEGVSHGLKALHVNDTLANIAGLLAGAGAAGTLEEVLGKDTAEKLAYKFFEEKTGAPPSSAAEKLQAKGMAQAAVSNASAANKTPDPNAVQMPNIKRGLDAELFNSKYGKYPESPQEKIQAVKEYNKAISGKSKKSGTTATPSSPVPTQDESTVQEPTPTTPRTSTTLPEASQALQEPSPEAPSNYEKAVMDKIKAGKLEKDQQWARHFESKGLTPTDLMKMSDEELDAHRTTINRTYGKDYRAVSTRNIPQQKLDIARFMADPAISEPNLTPPESHPTGGGQSPTPASPLPTQETPVKAPKTQKTSRKAPITMAPVQTPSGPAPLPEEMSSTPSGLVYTGASGSVPGGHVLYNPKTYSSTVISEDALRSAFGGTK